MEDEKGVFKEDDKADMKKPREAKGFLRNDKREFKARARGRGIIRRGGSHAGTHWGPANANPYLARGRGSL